MMALDRVPGSAGAWEPTDRTMPNLLTLIAPLALWWSPGSSGPGDLPAAPTVARNGPVEEDQPMSALPAEWLSFLDPMADQSAAQVRIERRVILRISPRPMPSRQSMTEESLAPAPMSRVVERPVGKCLKIGAIAGARPDRGSRLMLFLRDQRIIAADLERACSARDFYSGFYVESNDDGMLCIDRDRLQSRSGAKCQVTRLRQMIVEQD